MLSLPCRHEDISLVVLKHTEHIFLGKQLSPVSERYGKVNEEAKYKTEVECTGFKLTGDKCSIIMPSLNVKQSELCCQCYALDTKSWKDIGCPSQM